MFGMAGIFGSLINYTMHEEEKSTGWGDESELELEFIQKYPI